jgi:hypothetical protein
MRAAYLHDGIDACAAQWSQTGPAKQQSRSQAATPASGYHSTTQLSNHNVYVPYILQPWYTSSAVLVEPQCTLVNMYCHPDVHVLQPQCMCTANLDVHVLQHPLPTTRHHQSPSACWCLLLGLAWVPKTSNTWQRQHRWVDSTSGRAWVFCMETMNMSSVTASS